MKSTRTKSSQARWTLALLAATATLSNATSAIYAQETEEPTPTALTEPPSDDANYVLMGEYLGTIAGADGATEPLGLQIRSVGGNNFEALQFAGGLPGDNVNSKPIELIGRRSGDSVIMSGGPWALFVSTERCNVVDSEGKLLGSLERMSRTSPTLNAKAPEGAIVLFDGTNTDQFTNGSMTEDGLLMHGADLKPMFQDFDLHVEFRLPYMPESSDQSRGNSGCYLQSRYEVQVLDSFAQLPVFNGCASIYRFKTPDINMCYPPLVWQTYDIRFTAPRWASDGSKIRNARITVWHNGVKVQDDVEVENKTGAGKPEEPLLLPIKFQDHGDPVRFRNIWIIDRGLTGGIPFPVEGTPEAESVANESPEATQEESKE